MIDMYNQEITLDISGRNNGPLIYAKQGDKDTRTVTITLVENGSPYKIGNGITLEFRCKKPSGYVCDNPATLNADGSITAILTEQSTAEAGMVIADIALRSESGKILSSSNFQIRVIESASSGDKIDSENELLILNQLVDSATKSAEEAKKSAEEAKDLAGTLETDKTLSQKGKAADAGATGRAIGTDGSASGEYIEIESQDKPVITGIKVYGKSEQQTTTGKNLIHWPYFDGMSKAVNGITFTVNYDGSVTANGTATEISTFTLERNPIISAASMLSGSPSNGSLGTYALQYANMVDNDYTDDGTGIIISQFDNSIYPESRLQIVIGKGYVANKLVFYPQIELGSVKTDYEPPTNGPSPNPSYPQPITSIGDDGEFNITTVYKNAFDYDFSTVGVISASGTINEASEFFVGNWIFLPKGIAKIYIRNAILSTDDNIFRIGIWNKDGTFNRRHTVAITDSSVSFNVTGDYIRVCNFRDTLKNADICVNIVDDSEEYEPHATSSKLTAALPLCAIPVSSGGNYTDENGQQYIADVLTVNADGSGQVEKLCEIFTLTSEIDMVCLNDFTAHAITSGIRIVQWDGLVKQYTEMISNSFSYVPNMWNIDEEGIAANYPTVDLRILNSTLGVSATSSNEEVLAAFRSWIINNPTYFVVQKTLPKIIPLTPAEVQAVLKLQGFAPKTTITAEGAPMEVYYATGAIGKAYETAKNTAATMLGYIADMQAALTETQAQMI